MFKFFKKKEKQDELKLDLECALQYVIVETNKINRIPRFVVEGSPLTLSAGYGEAFEFKTALAKEDTFSEATVRIIVNNRMDYYDIARLFLKETNKALELFENIVDIKYSIHPCGVNYIGQIYIEGKLKQHGLATMGLKVEYAGIDSDGLAVMEVKDINS